MRLQKFLQTSILSAALLFAPLVASATGWSEFRAPDGFAVSMPTSPQQSSSDQGTIVGKVHTSVYCTHTANGDYTVAVTRLPGMATMFGGGKVYSESRKQFLKTNNATEVSYGDSSFAGHKAKELVYTSATSEGRCEMFMVGHRFYCIDANHPRGNDAAENNQFFASFHLMPSMATGD